MFTKWFLHTKSVAVRPWLLGTMLMFLLTTARIVTRNRSASKRHSLGRRVLHSKPVMYTFYNHLLEDEWVTAMSPEADAALLQVWRESWASAGWEPRILSLADAERHPEFSYIQHSVDQLNLDGYNKMCIFRWVAMAAIGSGWMSDYDTFPIRDFSHEAIPLPHEGFLTVHDGIVPDLVSGTGSEWLRLVKRIVENTQDHVTPNDNPRRRKYTLWSDMKALVELKEKHDSRMFQSESIVLGNAFRTHEPQWSHDLCQQLTPPLVKAVHFSHASIKRAKAEGYLEPDQGMHERGAIAKSWLNMWRRSCGTTR